MKNSISLSEEELTSIFGGKTKYYGNGVYCNSKKCWVDWAKATTCIAGLSIGGFLGGAVPGIC